MFELPLSSTAQALRASVFADLAPLVERHLAGGGQLVPLHIGDTYLPPPEGASLAEAAAACSESELHKYGPIGGDATLVRASVEWLKQKGRPFPGVEARHVLVGGGATHALFCAARALFDPGDEVIVLSPYWPLSVGVLRAAGAIPVEAPCMARIAEDPGLTVGEVLEPLITPRTRGLYLISPNNPDGTVLPLGIVEALGALARERNLWVLSDEVYADYVYDCDVTSIASLRGMADRTVTAYSFSKSHALAGARVGLVVGPERVIQLARRVSTHTLFNVPVVAQRACARALQSGDAWVEQARRTYREARDVCAQHLQGFGDAVRYRIPEGGTYVFIDFAPMLRGRPLRLLLERAVLRGVFLAPGDAFGAGFERHARLCYSAVPLDALDAGLEALEAAVEDVA